MLGCITVDEIERYVALLGLVPGLIFECGYRRMSNSSWDQHPRIVEVVLLQA